ncbi:trichohyalin [Parasponia andersonii]|uniref:Trichohyalin n=1 Tax=Parasponia andersonii TaxID=3476 RepID=A0A2P5CZB6_PARAD|nr:trichohyalin [Parasponia andersonii]
MAVDYAFADEDMEIDETVGYPRAYARLCRDRGAGPYGHGPPFTFMPYCLHEHEFVRAMELDHIFPIIDPKAKQTGKPKLFVSLLWKQLNHLGNAGFDPAVIRVDTYGNVLYFHADSASPLAWDIDHWFPCSRGGLTVPSNLRILQWQACKKKHNKLEFLIPWWDFQLGISVNQFLSIFASSNSDFRHRAFSFLFSEGENEELNSSQTVDSHSFPQHFVESKEKLGLAPAAIVASRRESYPSSLALQSLDYNRLRPRSPALGARKAKTSSSKENENPDFYTNPYHALVMARDSMKQREETSKMQAEIQKLDNEVSEMRRMNEEEKVNIQDLELALIKRRRRAEKSRKLAEAQSSYRTMLEKMIRDAMHQSVIYKEQVRLNQAASAALMARLEAQKAICDASEKELHKKYKQRDELEKQIRPEWEQARKRSRMDDTLIEERDQKPVLLLPGIKQPRTPLHKELRVFLEEEQRASEAGLSLSEDEKKFRIGSQLEKSEKNFSIDKCRDRSKAIVVLEDDSITEHKFSASEIAEEENKHKIRFPATKEPEIEEDEESRKERGKGNVEKWLQMLLDSAQEDLLEPQHEIENGKNKTDDIIRKLNLKYPQKEGKSLKYPESEDREEKNVQEIDGRGKGKEKCNESEVNNAIGGVESSKASEERRSQSVGKERKLARSESFRAFRRIPSSPSIILGMKKGVDCIGKKPMVRGDDEDYVVGNNSFLKSSMKTIKKAVKI